MSSIFQPNHSAPSNWPEHVSMRITSCLTAGIAFLLACCAHVTDFTWPEHGSDPYPWPKPEDAANILYDRFAQASTNAMGTTDDIVAVKKVIAAHFKPQKVMVREIRWLSSTLVMAFTCTEDAGFYYVAEKKKVKWGIRTYYMLWVI